VVLEDPDGNRFCAVANPAEVRRAFIPTSRNDVNWKSNFG